jgi:hypothetical protein
MNIYVEGPRWSGMWTEIIADALHELGHQVDYGYHNHKTARDRLTLAVQSLAPGSDRKHQWAQRQRQRLLARLLNCKVDILLSIQGNIDRHTASLLRKHAPGLRIIYWWGDILTAKAHTRLREAAGFADRLLVSYLGAYQALQPSYGKRLQYFPFGTSKKFHTPGSLSARNRERFGKTVAFVGTYYPERCALIRHLNQLLETPVAVWGRGWRKCHGVKHHGALSLADSLKVYHCSRIVLNLHHVNTPNGFNMKYFEIPAAGGFQLCDWQPLMDAPGTPQAAIACRSAEEFSSQIDFYLEHEQQRHEFSLASRASIIAASAYKPRLATLLQGLAASDTA